MFAGKLLIGLFTFSFAALCSGAPVVDGVSLQTEQHPLAVRHNLPRGGPGSPGGLTRHNTGTGTGRSRSGSTGGSPAGGRTHCQTKRASRFENANGALTLYRAIKVTDVHLNPKGGAPLDWEHKQGDFSVDGGYYMFSSEVEAKYYGNAFKHDGSHYVVLTLKWTPTAVTDVAIKSWTEATTDWRTFVQYNYKTPKPDPISPDGAASTKHYDMIVGPLSDADKHYNHDESSVDCTPLFQYAVVTKKGLGGLKVEEVTTHPYKESWLEGGPEPTA